MNNILLIRAFYTILTAFSIVIFLGPFFIKKLISMNVKQSIRLDGPKNHLSKNGTPTMGGLLVLFSIIFSCLIWCNLFNKFSLIILFTFLSFSYIGFLDDYNKIIRSNSDGISVKSKLISQIIFALLISFLIIVAISCNESNIFHSCKLLLNGKINIINGFSREVYIPFTNRLYISLNFWQFISLSTFIIVGSSNAVNLTDGLDGLVIFPIFLVSSSLALLSYCFSNGYISNNFIIDYRYATYEITVITCAISGSSLAFLWFNFYPAKIFLGDVGSLSLGATLAVIAIIIQQECVFFIISGLFVLETISVLFQVCFFKLTRRIFGKGIRIFRMAPLHHHFEIIGWKETQVIIRFWIINVLLIILGTYSIIIG